MISLYTILTIALYESKVLLRSWFFRIFSVLSLGILVFFNIGLFATRYSPWMFRGIPSFIPYVNIMLVNVIQAVIGVFMASDFLKYDQKLDTTDVIYMRSLTNADYVLGKTLGVLGVFGVLNITVLLISGIFNVFLTKIPFVPEVYILYPLLISLPTLLFIFGLSFMFMVIIRNQAVTFVVLLGYIAVTLFFLGHRFHYLFDYMAFSVPLMYSDFVGFGDMTLLLIHRSIYLLFGTGFIFTTILLLRRLPQSRIMNYFSLIAAVCSIAGGLALGNAYITQLIDGRTLREEINASNRKMSDMPKVSVKSCDIELTHAENEIDAKAHLVFSNDTQNPINKYIFSLNPGLEIKNITVNGGNILFSRNLHLITVEPENPLEPGTADSLTVAYSGSIDEEACYPDVDEETREANFRILFFAVGKRYAFITPGYVLLTHENLWYPAAGVPYGSAYPDLPSKDFVKYTLTVKTSENLTAVSQGASVSKAPGEFYFEPEYPLPRLSLVIGRYEKRSITVEDTEYAVFFLEGHDYFSEYFGELGEKLSEIISGARSDMEFKLGLDYPFKRLSLIETPVQFFAYTRLWTVSTETVQPEQVLLPEKGITIRQADFSRSTERMNRMAQRGQRAMTPEEMQENIARQFVNTLTSDISGRTRLFRRRPGIFNFGDSNYTGYYSIFPSFYTYVFHSSSGTWPIFNVALEYYLNSKIESGMSQFARNISGLSAEENANQALKNKSFSEILADTENSENIYDVLKTKCAYLFSLIKSELGNEEFSEFLGGYIGSHSFTDSGTEDFAGELRDEFGFDIEPFFEDWLHGKRLPAFIVSNAEGFEFFDWESTRFQVFFKVTNLEPVDGLVSVAFRSGGRGGRGGRGFGMMFSGGSGTQETERIYRIEAGQTKEIGIILDESPRIMTINTNISQNIPSTFERWFEKLESNDDAETFDGDRISDSPIIFTVPGDIVIDNEDAGFDVHAISSESFLKKIINRNKETDEDEYVGLQFWSPPRRWKATTAGNFYGLVRHSAYFIRAGKGENRVSWKAEIPGSGHYDVYYYASQIRSPWMRRGRDSQRTRFIDEFQFFISHDDGVDEVKLDVSDPREGWNLLGTYYFSEGPAKVELTDLSKGRIVYADAVKWAEQK